MAGPLVSIVSENKFSTEDTCLIDRTLRQISSKKIGNDLWIANSIAFGGHYEGTERPFIVAFGEDYQGEFKELETCFCNQAKWKTLDMISISAGNNDDCDHRILGQMALYFVERLCGYVFFGNSLENYTSDSQLLSYKKRIRTESHGDFFDAALMKKWLNHRDFRMVK